MIAYPGELFMRLLKLMILPLVIASLIAGSASLNAKVDANYILHNIIKVSQWDHQTYCLCCF